MTLCIYSLSDSQIMIFSLKIAYISILFFLCYVKKFRFYLVNIHICIDMSESLSFILSLVRYTIHLYFM